MPGNNPGDGGDYYCDANFGNNIWCPEYDTWEGNKYTMAGNMKMKSQKKTFFFLIFRCTNPKKVHL